MEKITLSPSGLGDLARCPRCFYDDKVLKIPHPRGIFPTLPGGMDRVMKEFFDIYRHDPVMPNLLREKVPGILYQDMTNLKRWRMWQTAPQYFDGGLNVVVRGGIDDMLIDGDFLIPLDVKTKGMAPKTDGSEYYQTQMDCYNLIFKNAGFQVREKAFLCYIFPIDVDQIGVARISELKVTFDTKVFELQCSMQRAKDLIEKACHVLRGPRPSLNPICEYCVWQANIAAVNSREALV